MDAVTDGRIRFVFFRIVCFIILSNLSILATMAADRLIAVFRPYTYKTVKSKIRRSALVLIAFCALETIIASLFYTEYFYSSIAFVGTALCCGLIIISVYLVIICKLYRERRRVNVGVSNRNVEASTRLSSRGAWTTADHSSVYGQSERYVQYIFMRRTTLKL